MQSNWGGTLWPSRDVRPTSNGIVCGSLFGLGYVIAIIMVLIGIAADHR